MEAEIATNVPYGCPGVGGSPGEGVYVKLGAAPGEEYTVIDQQGNFLFTSTLPRNPDCAPAGYDCLPGHSVAKNILTMGAVDDLPGGYSPLSGPDAVLIASFSGWGPARRWPRPTPSRCATRAPCRTASTRTASPMHW